jgi:hypothetical protein
MYFDTLNETDGRTSCLLLQMVVKMTVCPILPPPALVLVSTALTQGYSHGLLLSCACELNPMTIITATKVC